MDTFSVTIKYSILPSGGGGGMLDGKKVSY